MPADVGACLRGPATACRTCVLLSELVGAADPRTPFPSPMMRPRWRGRDGSGGSPQMQVLLEAFSSRSAQPPASALLFGTSVQSSQQVGQPGALARQAREPGLLPGACAPRPRPDLASAPSRLLA